MFIPSKAQAQSAINQFGSPVFITDGDLLREQVRNFVSAFEDMNAKIFYALKANFNPHLVKIIKDGGIYGIDAVSPNEVRLALELGYDSAQIIFTPSNPSNAEIQQVGEMGVLQNLDSLSGIDNFGKLFPGQSVSARICPEVGSGESEKVNTGGLNSKFGITQDQLSDLRNICKKYDLRLVGIHSHIGSGFYDPIRFATSVQAVCDVATTFENIDFVDFGGGFGVSYNPDQPDIDIRKFTQVIRPIVADYKNKTGKSLELRVEPGKVLVSQSTALCATVTTVKKKGEETFVGIDAGFANYLRPAMYGSYQHFVNLSNPEAEKSIVQVVGNVCETCDVFNPSIDLAKPQEGDVLAMLVAGGYGSSMSSNYNMRTTLPEVLIENGQTRLIRRPQTFREVLSTFIVENSQDSLQF